MTDIFENLFKGHIRVECLDSNNKIIDVYDDHNMIMTGSRYAVAKLVARETGAIGINKIVFGTLGHKDGDPITPKTEAEGFVSTRTNLFSEESGAHTYPITFGETGNIISEPDYGSSITVTRNDKNIVYTCEIQNGAANNGGISVFTEAALYAGDDIFAMKCFPAKVKDETVSIRVTWTILF